MRDITGNAADHASMGWGGGHAGQQILNARPIPPRREQHDCLVDVTARLVWEDDGVEFVQTRATAWAGRDVLVDVDSPRYRLACVWIDVGDAPRRR